jgi:hypothetical protein
MLSVTGGVVAALLFLIWLLPYTYVYETTLGASSAGGYHGPIKTLIARVTSREVLEQIAAETGLDGGRGVGGLLAGMDPDPVGRLGVRVVVEGDVGAYERVVVEAKGRFDLGAKTATQLIAARLSAFDRQMRLMTRAQRERGELVADDAAPGQSAAVELEKLRQEYPVLRDTQLLPRFQREEPELEEEGSAIAALRIRYEGYLETVRRLEARVRDEAARLYAADQAERAALARKAAGAEALERESNKLRVVTRRTEVHTGPGLESLEQQLLRLLSVYQPRHPDVRKLKRLIKLARERDPSMLLPAPRRERDSRSEESKTEPVDYDAGVIFIADDEAPPVVAAAAFPAHWLQRAPSYVTWIQAQERANETRVDLDVRESAHTDRLARHEKLGKRLDALRAAQLKEIELLERVREEELTLEKVETSVYDPLLFSGEATLKFIESPWRIFPWGMLLGLLAGAAAGLIGSMQDRSFHVAKELSSRAALPVLGVIPHLRGR